MAKQNIVFAFFSGDFSTFPRLKLSLDYYKSMQLANKQEFIL